MLSLFTSHEQPRALWRRGGRRWRWHEHQVKIQGKVTIEVSKMDGSVVGDQERHSNGDTDEAS